jgi:hypothetical protein
MPYPEVVHIAPADSDWRLHRSGDDQDLYFRDLGAALDAASSLAANGLAIRIVVHQPAAFPFADPSIPDFRESSLRPEGPFLP